MHLKPPIIQIALDYATVDEALAMAKIGIEAGVDWLEVGTPLIISQGLSPIGDMVQASPGYPVLADYKTMDSGGKNVHRTKMHGTHLMTVCANAPDETIRSAIEASNVTGVWVVADTIGVKQQASHTDNAPNGACTSSTCTMAVTNVRPTLQKIRPNGSTKSSPPYRFLWALVVLEWRMRSMPSNEGRNL